jgi:hypothetical protein
MQRQLRPWINMYCYYMIVECVDQLRITKLLGQAHCVLLDAGAAMVLFKNIIVLKRNMGISF